MFRSFRLNLSLAAYFCGWGAIRSREISRQATLNRQLRPSHPVRSLRIPKRMLPKRPATIKFICTNPAGIQYGPKVAESDLPVVLDVWSTSCIPCMKEFPGLVRLHHEHGSQVRCVSVCIDYIGIPAKPPESYREKVETFLSAQNATLQNYLCSTPDQEVLSELEIGSIPAVFVYSQGGELEKAFVDVGETAGFTYEDDVIPFVQSMLDRTSGEQ